MSNGYDCTVLADDGIGIEMGFDPLIGVLAKGRAEVSPGVTIEIEDHAASVVVGLVAEVHKIFDHVMRDAALL